MINYCQIVALLLLSVAGRGDCFEIVGADPQSGEVHWQVGSQSYRASTVTSLVIASDPQSGARQIGLTHRGYTGPEPGGRVAILLFSIDLRSRVDAGGVSFVTTSGPALYDVDVDLPMDRVEEARLRADLGLPMRVRAGTLSTIEVRWQGVPGRKLMGWLDQNNGLRLKASATVTVTLAVDRTEKVDRAAFDAWWASRFGPGTTDAQWQGGADALVLDMLQSKVVGRYAVPSLSFGVSDDTVGMKSIAKCVVQNTSGTGTTRGISSAALFDCVSPMSVSTKLIASIPWRSNAQVSGTLTDDEIIDGTAQKRGLSALLADGS